MKLILMIPFFCFSKSYSYISDQDSEHVTSINIRMNFSRTNVDTNSFSHWLRNFPIKEESSEVMYFNGESKYNQSIHHRILDIDIGSKNLQQCADAFIRLRAEYLFSINHK